MFGRKRQSSIGKATGLLARLRQDTRGNALAMMAAMMIPLIGLTGSAIDMGRLYTVKSRLQQACDAGVLAGRAMMNQSSASPLTTATQFFNNNFKQGWYSTSAVGFTPKKTSDAEVSGTATALVPMTIMAMLGSSEEKVVVNCTARYDITDSDIMFVLDTTGSMAQTPSGGGGGGASTYTRADGTTGYYNIEASGSKISGLRSAVLSFYDTLAQAAKSDPTTHIRYGFVTYTSTVNAGKLLKPEWLAPKWLYQTRTWVGDQNQQNSDGTDKAPLISVKVNIPLLDCNALGGRSPLTANVYNSDGSAVMVSVSWKDNNCTVSTQQLMPKWRYGQQAADVSAYITGAIVKDPSKVTGAFTKWQGCIEERPTPPGALSSDLSKYYDLDPDLVPSPDVDSNGIPTDKDTRWRPMFPDIEYYRGTAAMDTTFDDTKPDNKPAFGDNSAYYNLNDATHLRSGYVSCGMPAQTLKVMSRADVDAYVNNVDFKAIGSTYHDTGMIWGTRLISPTGLFASTTAAWPGRPAPNRFIVFMTDGEMAPNRFVYGMYGNEFYDRRITGGDYTQDTAYHNSRFVAECSAAKARNITVFVVGFGQALNTQLRACASPGKAFYASDNDSLKDAFQQIAQQVAKLRISQ